MAEKWKKITGIVVTVFVIGLIGYDAFVISTAGKEASVSWVLIEYSYNYPIGVFVLGIVFGHLFWRMKDPRRGGKK